MGRGKVGIRLKSKSQRNHRFVGRIAEAENQDTISKRLPENIETPGM